MGKSRIVEGFVRYLGRYDGFLGNGVVSGFWGFWGFGVRMGGDLGMEIFW